MADNLTFEVKKLEGDLAGADGPAAVFIDIIGMPFTPLSFAGVARRTARRTAFYSAAAAGAYYPYAYGSRIALLAGYSLSMLLAEVGRYDWSEYK